MRRQAFVIASIVIAVLLAGCSTRSTPRPAGSPGSASRGGGSVAAVVQCFRAHGMPDFPDPVYDPGDGRWHFAISPASVPPSTRQACQSLFPAAPPSPDLPQAAFQQLVRFAQCMRTNSVPDWPDPSPDGAFHLNARLWSLGKHGGVSQAMQACHVPAGGLDVLPGT